MREAPRKPNEAESKIERAQDDNLIVQTREYELITPLFGGGVEPGQCDDLTPIRGTEVRGHLRFWWRATRGGRYEGDLDAMRKDEALLWGAASTAKIPSPSKVNIHVTQVVVTDKKHPFEVTEGTDSYGKPKPLIVNYAEAGPAYAAFPLQPQDKEAKQIGWKSKVVATDVRFKLELSFPAHKDASKKDGQWKQDVAAALWAWETFGGIGARTRRGFGALHLTDVQENDGVVKPALTPEVSGVQKYINDGLGKHIVAGKWPKGVPRIDKSESQFKIAKLSGERATVWVNLIEKLRVFRQARRLKNGKPYGRSYWPEADEIRFLSDQSDERHKNAVSEVRKFPRGFFGLPIVFHFKDNDPDDPHNQDVDPADTVLLPANHERWASPVILRPLQCKNGLAVGLALVLQNSTPAGGFTLKPQDSGAGWEPETVYLSVNCGEAGQIEPLKEFVKGKESEYFDVVTAFLKTLLA